MSDSSEVRRADKLMSPASVRALLETSYCGRLATVGTDGSPYICPLLYVVMQNEIWLHNTSASGHLRTNISHQRKVCFEVDVPGKVFPYGRFECDTSIEYRSVVVFGQIRIIAERNLKAAFFDALMTKYYAHTSDRPKSFYPRLDAVTVYAVAVDRMTGKQTVLPAVESQWPSLDQTKSPNVKSPA